MSRKQYGLMLVLAVIAGLVGGVVSSFLFMGTPVFAQKTEVADIIRAKRFEVVDKDGKLHAALYLLAGEPGLVLYDKNEKPCAEFSLYNGEPGLSFRDKNSKSRFVLGLDNGEPLLRFTDKNDKVIWSAP